LRDDEEPLEDEAPELLEMEFPDEPEAPEAPDEPDDDEL
jgi:segregation and condensation protein B